MMVMVKRQEEPGKRQATLSAYFFCWWNFFLLASKKKVRVVSLKITESRITIVDAPCTCQGQLYALVIESVARVSITNQKLARRLTLRMRSPHAAV